VQVHDLPLEMITPENAFSIGSSLGELLEVDNVDNQKPSRKSFLRLRVLIKVLRPLIPGFTHHRPPRAPTWVQYKYERLSEYCYFCGRLGHLSYACPVADRPPAHGRYGDVLKAKPPKFSRVVNLITARKPLECMFEPVVVSSSAVSSLVPTESTQLSLLAPSQSSYTSRALPQFQGAAPHPIEKNLSSLIPTFTQVALNEKAHLVLSPLLTHTPSLMIPKPNNPSRNLLQQAEILGTDIPISLSSSFSTCASQFSLFPKLDVLPSSLNETKLFPQDSTCSSPKSSLCTLRILPPSLSTKPPKYPLVPYTKKRFHPYSKQNSSPAGSSELAFPCKKSKVNPQSSEDGFVSTDLRLPATLSQLVLEEIESAEFVFDKVVGCGQLPPTK
jgi:hypothetical protein